MQKASLYVTEEMVRVYTRISRSCFRVSHAYSPPSQPQAPYKSSSQTSDYYENESGSSFATNESSMQSESKEGNRVMVVVDPGQEAKGALEWALSNAVQKEDTVILLHIGKPSKNGLSTDGGVSAKVYELLYTMKSICESKRPGVQVEVEALTSKEKGVTIIEQAKKEKATLLVLGHRRRSIAWTFLMRCFGRKRSSQSIVDYCIQNAVCMTIAVRRNSSRLGGYLITTKRHKKFWLLA